TRPHTRRTSRPSSLAPFTASRSDTSMPWADIGCIAENGKAPLSKCDQARSGFASKNAHIISVAEMESVVWPTKDSMFFANGLPGHVSPPSLIVTSSVVASDGQSYVACSTSAARDLAVGADD